MKQKSRFKNFTNTGYRSMNGRYIGIGPKKSHIGRCLLQNVACNLLSADLLNQILMGFKTLFWIS